MPCRIVRILYRQKHALKQKPLFAQFRPVHPHIFALRHQFAIPIRRFIRDAEKPGRVRLPFDHRPSLRVRVQGKGRDECFLAVRIVGLAEDPRRAMRGNRLIGRVERFHFHVYPVALRGIAMREVEEHGHVMLGCFQRPRSRNSPAALILHIRFHRKTQVAASPVRRVRFRLKRDRRIPLCVQNSLALRNHLAIAVVRVITARIIPRMVQVIVRLREPIGGAVRRPIHPVRHLRARNRPAEVVRRMDFRARRLPQLHPLRRRRDRHLELRLLILLHPKPTPRRLNPNLFSLPVPCPLSPVPCPLSPVPCPLFPVPCSLP